MMVPSWQFLVVALAGWLNRQQQYAIEYLREENRVLREQLNGKRIRFTDEPASSTCCQGQGPGPEAAGGSLHAGDA